MSINIAIDGPSAAGKSTIAKRLATKLDYIHLDTGAMYRACALASESFGVFLNDEDAIEKMMNKVQIHFDVNGHIYLNDQDVTDEIRSNPISMKTSKISQIASVRSKLVEMQQTLAKDKGYILDGRDIGTVVLPSAEVKIFLVASVRDRADRRAKEYKLKQVDYNYEEIYSDIVKRDYQDTHRKVSPLKKAEDAIEIDTSVLTIEEVVNKVLSIIHDKIQKEVL